MTLLIEFLGRDFIQAFTWAILHSLWQCAVIALFLGLILALFPRLSSSKRYLICLAAMLIAVCAAVNTFISNLYSSSMHTLYGGHISDIAVSKGEYAEPAFYMDFLVYFDQHAPIVFVLWFIGFIFLLLRYIADFLHCQKLKTKNIFALPEDIERKLSELIDGVGLKNKVAVFQSTSIQVPCALGHLRPVILLPLSIVAKLPLDKLGAIFLHELAHIRRHDYFISLAQSFLTLLFFFNPMLRWISSQADLEREHACDDFAVKHCQNPRVYAESLKEFADMSFKSSFVMAAHKGQKKLLLTRIKRLFPNSRPSVLARSTENFIASISLLACGIIGIAYADNEPHVSRDARPAIDQLVKGIDTEKKYDETTIPLDENMVLNIDEQTGRVKITMPMIDIDVNEETEEVNIDVPFLKLKTTKDGKVKMSLDGDGDARSVEQFIIAMKDLDQRIEQLDFDKPEKDNHSIKIKEQKWEMNKTKQFQSKLETIEDRLLEVTHKKKRIDMELDFDIDRINSKKNSLHRKMDQGSINKDEKKNIEDQLLNLDLEIKNIAMEKDAYMMKLNEEENHLAKEIEKLNAQVTKQKRKSVSEIENEGDKG